MLSQFGKLNWFDVAKGFLVAFLTVVITGVITTLEAGQLPSWTQLSALLITGLAAGLAYLLKNVFTNSKNEVGKKEAE